MAKKIIIGTRGSKLALWQAEHIKARLEQECGLASELKIVKTQGDKILDTPLAKIGGKGLFTKELEELLLSGEIDLAVHSLKDVPVEFPNNLGLVAITKREDWRDCFVSEKYPNLESLPFHAKIGTTSLRRSMQLKLYRADFDTLSLRGNVQTRLGKLKNGDFDAIILANAALKRLEIQSELPFCEPLESMLPAMGQGALGIECALDNVELITYLKSLEDLPTSICCVAEREFIKVLEGGCQVPIGVFARLESRNLIESNQSKDAQLLHLDAIIGLPDGSASMRSQLTKTLDSVNPKQSAKELGIKLAQHFLDNGARDMLERAYKMI